MTGGTVFLALLSTIVASPDAPSPSWSPDGPWVAFSSAIPLEPALPEPGWLFRTTLTDRVRPLLPTNVSFQESRLTLVLAGPGQPTVLVDSTNLHGLAGPVWDPSGHSLFYAKFRQDVDRSRIEIWRKQSSPFPTPLTTIETGSTGPEPLDLTRMQIAPCLGGKYLAVGRPWIPDILLLRPDTGRTIRVIENASNPTWSPDGSRLAYLTTGDDTFLCVQETTSGNTRALAGSVLRVQPAWARDGSSLFTVLNRVIPESPTRARSLELVSVSLKSQPLQSLVRMGPALIPGQPAPTGLHFTMSQDGEDLFYSIDLANQPTSIVWFRPQTGETWKRFHPIDMGIRISGLALSSDGKTLAVRYGPPAPDAPVALTSVELGDATPLIPDEASRLAWARLLVESSRRLVHLALPPAAVEGRPVERPTLVPIPGEVGKNAEIGYRVRRIARLGALVCEGPAGAEPSSSAAAEFLNESSVFFEALRENWSRAEQAIERLERRTITPQARLRLACLRAQFWLAEGDDERVRDMLKVLRGPEFRTPMRIESSLEAYQLMEDRGFPTGWADYLDLRLRDAEAARRNGKNIEAPPLGHRNPDNPNDGIPIQVPFDRFAPPPAPTGRPIRR